MLTKQLALSPTITEQGEPSNTFIPLTLHQQSLKQGQVPECTCL